MPALREVIVSITSRCNFHCKMCDIPGIKTEELPTAALKDIIKDSSGLGVQTIVLSGGEPLLRKDIFELISYAKSQNMSACLTSNGSLIDEPAAESLCRAGVNVVNVSIEGSKAVHEALRGPGSYESAINGLMHLRKYKIESTVASTISRYNIESLSGIIGIAKECGATTVRFQPFNDLFISDKSRGRDFFMQAENLKTAEQAIEDVIRSAKENGIATNPESYLRSIPLYLCTGKVPFTGACNALSYSCPVDSEGNVFPCWKKTGNKYRLGSLKVSKLSDIWFSKQRERIIASILRDGCDGCMMACYDQVFDKDNVKDVMARKIMAVSRKDKKKLLQTLSNRVLQFVKGELTRWKFRIRFYQSYRGSWIGVLKRRVQRWDRTGQGAGRNELLGSVLSEIHKAKKRLNSQMSRSK